MSNNNFRWFSFGFFTSRLASCIFAFTPFTKSSAAYTVNCFVCFANVHERWFKHLAARTQSHKIENHTFIGWLVSSVGRLDGVCVWMQIGKVNELTTAWVPLPPSLPLYCCVTLFIIIAFHIYIVASRQPTTDVDVWRPKCILTSTSRLYAPHHQPPTEWYTETHSLQHIHQTRSHTLNSHVDDTLFGYSFCTLSSLLALSCVHRYRCKWMDVVCCYIYNGIRAYTN